MNPKMVCDFKKAGIETYQTEDGGFREQTKEELGVIGE
jgi:hypothetical protein